MMPLNDRQTASSPDGRIGRRQPGDLRLACFAVILGFLWIVAGCAARYRPVLYPNPHLQSVGEAQAQRDIDECEVLAEKYIKDNPGADAAKSTVAGGAAGAVIGGATGAVTGSLGRGIGIGPRSRRSIGPGPWNRQSLPAVSTLQEFRRQVSAGQRVRAAGVGVRGVGRFKSSPPR